MVTASDYYETFPPNEHAPGDVWRGLPTFGVAPKATCAGIVITPACDLANRKVETVTWLPVVPVAAYMCSRATLDSIVSATLEQLHNCGLTKVGDPDTPDLSQLPGVRAIVNRLNEMSSDSISKSAVEAAKRARAGLALIESIRTDQPRIGISSLLELLGRKPYSELKLRVVRNARSDTHFLPSDCQSPEWSAVPTHSVALFRYPLTMPIDIFDMAVTTRQAEWPFRRTALASEFPCAGVVADERPMKCLRVRQRFMSDLLTRFIGLYGRLGSPDFSEPTVARYLNEIEDKHV